VQAILTRPFYAARVVHEGKTFAAKHRPLIDPSTFDLIQGQRAERDLGSGQHKAGRPARRHLLTRLARCGACGETMYCFTSPYRRKDGGRQRLYRCGGFQRGFGLCSASFDAERIDTAVMENLHRLIPDFDKWIKAVEDRHAAERKRLQAVCDRASNERDDQARKVEKLEARWASYDDHNAELVLPIVERERRALADSEVRLTASRDALASIPEDAPHDQLLDFASSLRETIRGKVAGTRTVEQVNRALIEVFSAFYVMADHDLPDGVGLDVEGPKRVAIEPSLRPEVAALLLADTWPDAPEQPAPPMEWLEALRDSDPGPADIPTSPMNIFE